MKTICKRVRYETADFKKTINTCFPGRLGKHGESQETNTSRAEMEKPETSQLEGDRQTVQRGWK